MVFATSVAIAADGQALVSTSGDASARVTELPGGSSGGVCGGLTFVLLLLAAAAAVWLVVQHRMDLMLLTQRGVASLERKVLEADVTELERPVEL